MYSNTSEYIAIIIQLSSKCPSSFCKIKVDSASETPLNIAIFHYHRITLEYIHSKCPCIMYFVLHISYIQSIQCLLLLLIHRYNVYAEQWTHLDFCILVCWRSTIIAIASAIIHAIWCQNPREIPGPYTVTSDTVIIHIVLAFYLVNWLISDRWGWSKIDLLVRNFWGTITLGQLVGIQNKRKQQTLGEKMMWPAFFFF